MLTGPNTIDPSFTLTANPNSPSPIPAGGDPSYVVVADSSGFPLNSWIPNSLRSEWIGPVASQPEGVRPDQRFTRHPGRSEEPS